MIYLLVAFAIPPSTDAVYCPHRRCDLEYYSSKIECEHRAMAEPVQAKIIFRCLSVKRREDSF